MKKVTIREALSYFAFSPNLYNFNEIGNILPMQNSEHLELLCTIDESINPHLFRDFYSVIYNI